MKILHFCPLPLFSGLEQYALAVAKKQIELGLSVGFVALKGSELESECAKVGVPTEIVDFNFEGQLFKAAQVYLKILEQHPEIEIIHLHTSYDIPRVGLALKLAAWRAGRSWRRPKVIQQNHIWISHSKKDPIHWLTYRCLDEIWCSSAPARRDLLRYLPGPASRIHIVPYGRDLEGIRRAFLSRDQARRELGLPMDAVVLGAIARIDQAKGIWELLNGAIQAMARNPQLHLVVVGGPTLSDPKALRFAERVDEFVKTLPFEIRERIHMAGSIPGAGKLLPAFDLYAQVSYKETFSLALLDAQLAGLPVLGTNSGGTPEVVREGKTGWLCEPESIESLSSSLERALANRSSWSAFGETAKQRVQSEFDFSAVTRMILDRYGIEKAGVR
ncbi:MAG TPA: glycosyltransferase family 4 protein [Bdellovibrionales bacterium]|nr:glycosyltransferase family 4 protein [Bdellovibrionales bacterium]